jgi:hypothetical protein
MNYQQFGKGLTKLEVDTLMVVMNICHSHLVAVVENLSEELRLKTANNGHEELTVDSSSRLEPALRDMGS